MRFVPIGFFALALLALAFVSSEAEAKSCSSFATITAFDVETSTIEVKWEKGKERKFFPKPEGTPADTSKIPEKCRRKVTKETSFAVKTTGGRMSITQVRSNFQGKMLNDTDDAQWVSNKLKGLIETKTKVVIVLRPPVGKKKPLGVTTVYLPITDEELAEIKRLEDQAEDA